MTMEQLFSGPPSLLSAALMLLERWYRQLEPVCIDRVMKMKTPTRAGSDAIAEYHLLDDIECYDLTLEVNPSVVTPALTTTVITSIDSASLGFSTKRLGYSVRVKLFLESNKTNNNSNSNDNNKVDSTASSSSFEALRLWTSVSIEVNERELREYLVRDQAGLFIREFVWAKIKALIE